MLTRHLLVDVALRAWPWLLLPPLVLLRGRRSASLADVPEAAPPGAPLVSIVIPARNERHNVERCLHSVLASTWPRLEVILVDDHSDDGTGELAEAIASGDARLRVVRNPDLPPDWFGKQWACATGASVASGAIVGFVDADTTFSPDLIGRTVNAMLARGADLLSIAGTQELGSFWERVVQPQVFTVLFARFGGTESVSRARRPVDKIANGQCLFVRREAYDAIGGHAAVRHNVAEDLLLAQRFCAEGRSVHLILGVEQLRTRMYSSLGELVGGWRKNVFAGGRESMPFGRAGRLLFPFLLLLPALYWLWPPIALLLGALGLVSHGTFIVAAVATAASLLWWTILYVAIGLSPLYALTYPLGAAVMLWIDALAILGGNRVVWKNRSYLSR